MTSVGQGAVREVWFAPVATPSNKKSFLIRDDAYSKRGADLGRTIRLGEPINLGPKSTWRQLTWEGGLLQDQFQDGAMYYDGLVDSSTQRGRLKLHPGWQQVVGETRRGATRWTASNARTGGYSVDRYLYLGECCRIETDPDTGTYTPPGGAKLWRYDPAGGSTTQVATIPSSITAMVPHNDDAFPTTWIAIGRVDGAITFYRPSDNALLTETGLHTSPVGPVHADSLCQFQNGLYWGGGRQLWRRTATRVNPTDAFTVEYRMVKDHPNADSVRGCTVWNNRLWYATVTSQTYSVIWQTDGQTVIPSLQMPGEFEIHDLQPHYGSLYISGNRVNPAGGIIGEIWRYTGASLTKLWSSTTEKNWAHNDQTFGMVSLNEFLYWTRNGHAGNGNLAGVWMYDAEQDAILAGPTLPNASGSAPVTADALFAWSNTLVCSFNQGGTYGAEVSPAIACILKYNGETHPTVGSGFSSSWNNVAKTVSRYLVSSVYDGEIPGEQKTWLAARVRCKIDSSNESVEVRVILDDNFGTEYSLGTITYSGDANWRTVTLPIKAGGDYLRSYKIRYKLVLNQTNASGSTGNPEIDAVDVDWMVSPLKRREWRLRIVASNAQQRLDGTNNPLNTTDLIRQALEDMWSDHKPVLFWDADPDGGTPVSAGTEVFITDFLDQPYKVDTETSEIAADISIGVLELV